MKIIDQFKKSGKKGIVKPKVKYEVGKLYQWQPSDIFSLTGAELEYMFKFVSEFLSTPSSQHVLKMLETHKILEAKIAKGVEEGGILEANV